MSDRETELDALGHLGLTADGKVLIDMLLRRLQEVVPVGSEPGALSDHEGGRRLARELIEKLSRDQARDGTSTLARPRTEPVGGLPRPRGATRPVAAGWIA